MTYEIKIPALYIVNYLKPIARKYGLRLTRLSGIEQALRIASKLN